MVPAPRVLHSHQNRLPFLSVFFCFFYYRASLAVGTTPRGLINKSRVGNIQTLSFLRLAKLGGGVSMYDISTNMRVNTVIQTLFISKICYPNTNTCRNLSTCVMRRAFVLGLGSC